MAKGTVWALYVDAEGVGGGHLEAFSSKESAERRIRSIMKEFAERLAKEGDLTRAELSEMIDLIKSDPDEAMGDLADLADRTSGLFSVILDQVEIQ